MREIGERLQARARELGLTDSEVARRLGLAQGRYSNYVNGVREPDMATFIRICRELASTPNEMLGFPGRERRRAAGARARVEALLDGLGEAKLGLVLKLIKVVADSGLQDEKRTNKRTVKANSVLPDRRSPSRPR